MRSDLIRRTAFLTATVIGILAFYFSVTNPTARVPEIGYVVVPATATSPTGYHFCDFAVHFNYLRQIWHHEVERPYRLDDQAQMMRNWLPGAGSGMPHAYSPVALVLMLPLLGLSTGTALLVFKILGLVLLQLLILGYLRSRAINVAQALAVLLSFFSLSFFATVCVGQTSIVTTCLLAFGWALLQRRDPLESQYPALLPLSLALVLWFLAFKPSFAAIWVVVLIAAKAWRALGWAAGFLLLTWVLLGPRYGGWITGLQDYTYLLGHYYQEAMPPFLQPGCTPPMNTNFNSFLVMLDPDLGAFSFNLNRILFLAGNIAAILLCWRQRLTLSQLFQAALWNYLLFCPQLCATEDWVICLLAVEGNFFRPTASVAIKLALLWAIVNLRWGFLTDLPLFFPVKLTLAAWWCVEIVWPPSAQALPVNQVK